MAVNRFTPRPASSPWSVSCFPHHRGQQEAPWWSTLYDYSVISRGLATENEATGLARFFTCLAGISFHRREAPSCSVAAKVNVISLVTLPTVRDDVMCHFHIYCVFLSSESPSFPLVFATPSATGFSLQVIHGDGSMSQAVIFWGFCCIYKARESGYCIEGNASENSWIHVWTPSILSRYFLLLYCGSAIKLKRVYNRILLMIKYNNLVADTHVGFIMYE